MDGKCRVSVVFALVLSIALSMHLFWSTPVSAMTPGEAWEAAQLQPPPEAPPGPPPGSGAVPDDDQPAGPYDSPSYPNVPPANDEPYVPEDSEPQGVPDSPPAMPSVAPFQLEPLPSPGWAIPSPNGGDNEQQYLIVPQTVGGGLRVSVDQGCGATYTEGDSIQFSVSADWEVFDFNTDWWRYLEVWSSTNGAWWQQVTRGRWIEPRDSVHVRAWIAAPTGDERIYARLLDSNGFVLDEANCFYTSQEEAPTTTPPIGNAWIACGEAVTGYVGSGDEEFWYFEGWSGQRVTINMYGHSGFDTFLELYSPNGNFVASHDDISGSNKNSKLRLNLSRSGVYTISAHGYDYRAGGYTLYLDC